MITKPEQLSELHRKNIDTAMKLAQLSIGNSQRIVALQVDIAKKMLQDSVENAKALAGVKDPQQALSLQSQYAQHTAQQIMESARQLAEIGNASRTEFTQLISEQFSGGNKEILEGVQSLFQGIPGQNNLMSGLQQAMTKTFEQFSQMPAQAAAAARHGQAEESSAPARSSRKKA